MVKRDGLQKDKRHTMSPARDTPECVKKDKAPAQENGKKADVKNKGKVRIECRTDPSGTELTVGTMEKKKRASDSKQEQCISQRDFVPPG